MNRQTCLIILSMLLFAVSASADNDRQYMGFISCSSCHESSSEHNPFSKYLNSKHSKAYEVLFKKESLEIARISGIDIPPYESPVCLGCHSTAYGTEDWERDEVFSFEDGVQCEACHGRGSAHMESEGKVHMEMPDEFTCFVCHRKKFSHTQILNSPEFDFWEYLKKIIHMHNVKPGPGKGTPIQSLNKRGEKKRELVPAEHEGPVYKTPYGLALSKDGTLLFSVCEQSDSLIISDTQSGKKLAEITVENQPHGVCLSGDDSTAYVSNRGSDTVSVVNLADYSVSGQIKVGDEPHGLVLDKDGDFLYVANAGTGDISVVNLSTMKEEKRLSAGRGTWGIRRSPDGCDIFVTNNLSHFVPFRTTSVSEVTDVNTEKAIVKTRYMIDSANLIQGVDFSPDGEFAMVTLIRTKNLIPMTRVLQGWVLTNGIGIIWKNGQVDQLLLDETENYFSDPTDIVITPDGKYAFVSGGGIQKVAMINIEKMQSVLNRASKRERKEVFPNHLGLSVEFVEKRIDVGRSPRCLVVSPDSRFVYVANGLDDTVSVISVEKKDVVKTIDLEGPGDITMVRRGERIFHSADITFGHQFACHTCHPDGGIDAITYDIEPDGLGINPVDNRSLKGILDTAPFKWTGKNKTLARQCGPRLAVFFTRIDPFNPEQVIDLESYICTIPRNPNRNLNSEGLTEAQLRGKKLFERTIDNRGNSIPREKRCSFCHPAPYYTIALKMDVGTMSELDTHGEFDVPHLNNIYESAPYLHDGRSPTLEEIWTIFNPEDKHGVTNDMTKDQLNDLIEFLKTL